MMQPWFESAKLGIFVHWGIYAVGRRGRESWPIFDGMCGYDEYIGEMDRFCADRYDPVSWANLFARSGAKYAVLTTKHHDGVTLWPTEQESPCIPKTLGCGDLVRGFVDALRNAGLHVGLYFSHTDWSNRDHVCALSGLTPEEVTRMRSLPTNWRESMLVNPIENPDAETQWARFLAFHRAQITELLTRYHPVDLLWFDVMMGHDRFDYQCKELRDAIYAISPQTVINSRLEGYGDYMTPEQFIPVYPDDGPWELCVTTNNTWSFTGSEKEYKTPFELITMFCQCLGMGGNMLLNVGPDEHGVIPPEQVRLLETMGEWIRQHEDAVYGTERGLPHGYAFHPTSLNRSRDTVYVYMSHISKEATPVKGIRNPIKSVRLLGADQTCRWKRIGGAPWLNVPGTLWIDFPHAHLDEYVSVLKIELEGALDLYDGSGVEIDEN